MRKCFELQSEPDVLFITRTITGLEVGRAHIHICVCIYIYLYLTKNAAFGVFSLRGEINIYSRGIRLEFQLDSREFQTLQLLPRINVKLSLLTGHRGP
jgi:hypothetical protein